MIVACERPLARCARWGSLDSWHDGLIADTLSPTSPTSNPRLGDARGLIVGSLRYLGDVGSISGSYTTVVPRVHAGEPMVWIMTTTFLSYWESDCPSSRTRT